VTSFFCEGYVKKQVLLRISSCPHQFLLKYDTVIRAAGGGGGGGKKKKRFGQKKGKTPKQIL